MALQDLALTGLNQFLIWILQISIIAHTNTRNT